MVAVDSGFPRSPRGALKLARALVAAVAFLCFAASRAPGAYTALAVMEAAITVLFFLLYLLRLDQKLSWFFWPLADVFNSVIAALFLLVVCLFAVIVKTNNGTLAGGLEILGGRIRSSSRTTQFGYTKKKHIQSC